MEPTRPDSFAAWKEKNYRAYILGNTCFQLGKQMLIVAVGWEIYEKTHSAMALGYVGLAQVIPVLLLTLFAGHVADNNSRREVVIGAQFLMGIATFGLLMLSFFNGPVWGMYICLLLLGVGRSFHSPANAALMPQIVSQENFTNAVTLSSITFQIASIAGPSLGGLLIAVTHHAWPVYFLDFLCIAAFVSLLFTVKVRHVELTKKAVSFKSLMAGLSYVVNHQLILAAITLDLFAVLFGGATSLLPVYAKDILKVGANGLGVLQAAPAFGAIVMAYLIAKRGELRNSGSLLLWAVAGFGLVIVVFGLSHNFWLSFAMLFLSGSLDNISVVIRQSLVQLRTPDEMRGRVSAINYVFIGASNELGGFESGLVANFFGPVASIVSGGIATILIVFGTAFAFPGLRKLDRLDEENPLASEPALLEVQ